MANEGLMPTTLVFGDFALTKPTTPPSLSKKKIAQNIETITVHQSFHLVWQLFKTNLW